MNVVISCIVRDRTDFEGTCCRANVESSLYTDDDWFVKKTCAILSSGIGLATAKVSNLEKYLIHNSLVESKAEKLRIDGIGCLLVESDICFENSFVITCICSC